MKGRSDWLVDISGCPPEKLGDAAALRKDFEGFLRVLGVTVTEPAVRQVDGGGVHLLYLLGDSHFACHTFPDQGLILIDFFVWEPRTELDWRLIAETFRATGFKVARVDRGAVG